MNSPANHMMSVMNFRRTLRISEEYHLQQFLLEGFIMTIFQTLATNHEILFAKYIEDQVQAK